jgi:hypothetical protein
VTGQSWSQPPTRGLAEDQVLGDARAQADREFAAAGPVGRPVVATAVIVGMIGVAHIAGAFVYSYFYIRLGTPDWPPDGTELRGWLLPAGALVLLAASVPVAAGAWRGPATLALAFVLGTGALVAQALAVGASGYAIDANAYESLVLVLEGVSAAVLVAAVLVRGAVVGLLQRAPGDRNLLATDATTWTAAVLIWSVLWVVLHIGPRVV